MDNLRLILLVFGVVLIAGIYLWETRWRRSKPSKDLDDLDTSYLDDLGDTRSRKDYGYAWDPARPPPQKSGEDSVDDDAAEDSDNSFDEEYDEQDGLESDVDEIDDASEFYADEAADAQELDLALFGSAADTELEGLEFIVPGSSAGEPTTLTSAVAADGLLIALTVMAESKSSFSGTALKEVMDDLDFVFGQMGIFHKLSDPDVFNAVPLYSVANVLKPGTFDLTAIETFSTPGIAIFMQVSGHAGSVEAFNVMLNTGAEIAARLGGELRDESRSTLTTQAVNHIREQIVEYGRQTRLKDS